jgi:2-methylcitrate dehydratase PrpD
MTVAGELAEFLTRVGPADLPPQAVDYAAMLIASTFASAALGAGIESSVIMRDLARERGGTAEASVWFDAGPKLPVAEAAQVNAVIATQRLPTTAICATSFMRAPFSRLRRSPWPSGMLRTAKTC